jgi:AcrR family transcriptional regulator
MPRGGDPEVTRAAILDAAQKRLLEQGPTGLVLDAVAADAGVSKGGLLYHFPSKEALVEGLTARMLAAFDETQAALQERDRSATGAWTRAYLRSTVTETGDPADDSARLLAGLLAAQGGDPARLEAIRERFAAWQERLEDDGIDPVAATIVRLASDGLWLSALLGLPSLQKKLGARVLAALETMTRTKR